MNILITGCNGQLGNELQTLQSRYPKHIFYNTDILPACEGVVNYACLDITKAEDVLDFVEENNINGIINCAAYTAVDKAEEQEDIAYMLNAGAPEILAKAMGQKEGWMIHVSTDYVFNGMACRPYGEDAETAPESVYGKTKLCGEKAAMQNCTECAVVRTAWLYSEYGKNFVKTMIRLGKSLKELGVVADQIGSPTYALDLAEMIMTMVEKGVKRGIYHYTNEGVTSWYDFTVAIHRMAEIKTCKVSPIHTEEYPVPAPRPPYSVLDKTKIKKTYGVEIPHWEDALKRCMLNILKGSS